MHLRMSFFYQTAQWIRYYRNGGDGSTFGCLSRSDIELICRKFFKNGTKVIRIVGTSTADIGNAICKCE